MIFKKNVGFNGFSCQLAPVDIRFWARPQMLMVFLYAASKAGKIFIAVFFRDVNMRV